MGHKRCIIPITHRLKSRDRSTKFCIFLKILNNFSFLFCFAALSFLPKGIGGVLWILMDIIRKTVNLSCQCCFVLLMLKNLKIYFRKKWQMFKNQLNVVKNFFYFLYKRGKKKVHCLLFREDDSILPVYLYLLVYS